MARERYKFQDRGRLSKERRQSDTHTHKLILGTILYKSVIVSMPCRTHPAYSSPENTGPTRERECHARNQPSCRVYPKINYFISATAEA